MRQCGSHVLVIEKADIYYPFGAITLTARTNPCLTTNLLSKVRIYSLRGNSTEPRLKAINERWPWQDIISSILNQCEEGQYR